MATLVCSNIDSSNGLLIDGTKPLPKPMLTYRQWGSVAFTYNQFHKEGSRYQFVEYEFENCTNKITSTSPCGLWFNVQLLLTYWCSWVWLPNAQRSVHQTHSHVDCICFICKWSWINSSQPQRHVLPSWFKTICFRMSLMMNKSMSNMYSGRNIRCFSFS